MIGIIAALPREVARLVRGVAADPVLLKRGVHLYRLQTAVVVTAGMGAERAALAVEAALASGAIDEIISVGLAGSCSENIRTGEVVAAMSVIDGHTGERFQCVDAEGVVLVTTSGIASIHEKARLAGAYGAAMVDMEAATVARIAAERGLPFRALKGISDAHDFELASLSRFATKHGQFRTAGFALHTALRPHRWRKTARLGRASTSAIAKLTAVLAGLLAER